MKPIHELVDSPHSWPEDFSLENGNYYNSCVTCGEEFLGHKGRLACKICEVKALAKWEAMTEEERQLKTIENFKVVQKLWEELDVSPKPATNVP